MTKKKDPKDLLKPGPKSSYTLELAHKICRAIATSTDPLKKICDRNPDFPCKQTIMEWKYDHPGFDVLYAKAKREQADLFADEILTISDDDYDDLMQGEHGMVPNSARIQRHRLRVDSRKWIACKLLPKVYGDRTTNESTVTIINPADALKELK